MITPIKQLEKAINYIGGQTALAAALTQVCGQKIRQSHVSTWLNRDKKVPPQYCLPIEKLTEGKVKCVELRPDVFGRSA
jgi:DNA-binding transcriptional regulator YdaS (Cro superfamily)